MSKEKEFDGCDGALWHVEIKQENNEIRHEVDSIIYNYRDRTIEPDDLGFKYHVLTYKEDKTEAEVMRAYIGDVAFFINNHARAGYNGLMVKNKSIPKKYIKEMFKKILTNWEFSDKIIGDIVRQV